MARDIDAKSLEAIEEIVRAHFPGGMSVQEIAAALKPNAPPRRTLQYQLRQLVDQKRLLREGERRGSRYRAPSIAEATSSAAGSACAGAMLASATSAAPVQAAAIRPGFACRRGACSPAPAIGGGQPSPLPAGGEAGRRGRQETGMRDHGERRTRRPRTCSRSVWRSMGNMRALCA